MKTGILIEPLDNVAVVTSDIQKGDRVKVEDIILVANHSIPVGHKIAVCDIEKNQYIYKYGVPIGLANTEILKGDYVHIHNVADITEELCKRYVEKFMEGEIKNE